MSYTCPKDSSHQSVDSDYCSICGAKIAGVPAVATSLKNNLPAGTVPTTGPSSDSAVCPDCGTPRRTGARFCEVCRYNFDTNTSGSAPAPIQGEVSASASAPEKAAGTEQIQASQPAKEQQESQERPAPQPAADNADRSSQDVSPVQHESIPAAQTPAGPVAMVGPALQWEVVVRVDPSLYIEPDPAVPCPVNEPERVFPIDLSDNLIGRRSPRKDIFPQIPLTDPGISHRHAKILRQPDGTLVLLDVGSTNGTVLNGREVQAGIRTPLQDGDQITLGCWTRIIVQSRQVNN